MKKRYDEKEIECRFCHQKVKPIIKRNIMGMPFGLSPGPFFGRAGSSSSKRQRKYILVCPNCNAVIGAK